MQLKRVLLVASFAASCVAPSEPEDGATDSIVTGGKADGGYTAAELSGALRVANELSFEELDDDVPLSARAATNIVAQRPLASVEELDAVPLVGPLAFAALVAHAQELGWTGVLPSLTRFTVEDFGNGTVGRVIAASESTVAIGLPGGDADYGEGRVYVYERGAAGLQLVGQLPHPGTSGSRASFGDAIAIAGDVMAVTGHVGIPTSPAYRTFIYRRGSSGWALAQVLNGGATAVVLDDDFLAVSDVTWTKSGLVHLYYRSDSTWVLAETVHTGSTAFGDTLALTDDLLVIGARESGTYVWDLGQRSHLGMQRLDVVAESVAVTRGRIAVRRMRGDNVVQLYEPSATTWTHARTIDGPADAWIVPAATHAMALTEDTLVLGAARASIGPVGREGAVFVYDVDGMLLESRPGPATGSTFGISVALAGETVVIGASGDGETGAIYAH